MEGKKEEIPSSSSPDALNEAEKSIEDKGEQTLSSATGIQQHLLTKQETPPKEEPKNDKPKPAPTTASSWGGWGSWFSAATSVVSQVTDQYVKPTVNAVTDSVKELIQEDLQNIPPESEQTKSVEKQDNPSQKSEPDYKSLFDKPKNRVANKNEEPTPQQERKNVTEEQDQPDASDQFVEIMDKGMGIIGDSFGTIGSFFQSSYNAVTSEDTLKKGLEMGKKFAIGSVDALESVGKSALQILTVEEEITSSTNTPQKGKKLIRPFFVSTRQTPDHLPTKEELSFEDKINKNYFDELGGTTTLQQFEHISIDRSLKTQKLESKSSEEEKKTNNEFATFIKELLDESDANETTTFDLPKITLSEKVKKSIEILSKVKSSALDFSASKQELSEEISSISNSPLQINEKCLKEFEILRKSLDENLLEGIKQLSHFCSESVQILVFICEDLTENQQNSDSKTEKVSYLIRSCHNLRRDFMLLTQAFKSHIEEIAKYDIKMTELQSKMSEEEKVVIVGQEEELKKKSVGHLEHFDIFATHLLNNFDDCKKFLFPICKSLNY